MPTDSATATASAEVVAESWLLGLCLNVVSLQMALRAADAAGAQAHAARECCLGTRKLRMIPRSMTSPSIGSLQIG